MFRVVWTDRTTATYTKWFEGRGAAIRFAARRAIAVVFDPEGRRI
jgi:hypothetical protein